MRVNNQIRMLIVYHLIFGYIFISNLTTLLADDASTLTTNKTVVLTGENWCPYTCLNTLADKGLIVDVLQQAFSLMNVKTSYENETSMKRAVQNTLDGHTDVFLSAEIEQGNELYLTHEFFILDETIFVVRKDSGIHIEHPADLNKYTLGLITEYDYYDPENPWLETITHHQNIVSIGVSRGESHLLKLLLRKRIDIAIVNLDVAIHNIALLKVEEQLKIIQNDITYKVYPGFRRTPQGLKLRKIFLEGLKKLKASKAFNKIYKKYNIAMPDWNLYLG